MSWTYSLKINGYDFIFIDLEGTKGLIVPPDQDLSDEAYVEALMTAQDDWDHIESFMYLRDASDYWHRSPYDREQVNQSRVMYHAMKFLTQDSLTKPDWIREFVEDVKNGTPAFPPKEATPRQPKSAKPGYVYLLKSEVGHYKIGRTVNPENRQKTFGVQLPFRVDYECLVKTENMKGLEDQLHQKFADKRLDGEWFNLTPDDIEYIKRLAS